MPALTLGYKASAEQFPPQRLLDLAVAAESSRLRLGLDQRPLPALAPHQRPRPERARVAGRRVPGDEAGHARHVRAHAVVPLQPGDRGPGVRDARLSCPGPGDPGRRDRRVDERGPGRRRLARAERALRPAQGGRDAHPGAHRAGRRDRRLRRARTTGPTRRRSTTSRTSRCRSTSPRPGRPPRGSRVGSGTGSSAPRARARSCTPRRSCRPSPRAPRRPAATRRRWTA